MSFSKALLSSRDERYRMCARVHGESFMVTRFVFCLLIQFLLVACNAGDQLDQARLTPAYQGMVLSSIPKDIDPDGKYLIYLHGKIIEDQGVDAVSPQFGPYEFEEILKYLADAGFNVIGEVRTGPTDVDAYSDHVAAQVHSLLDGGVPGENITVIGFSKGGALAIFTSAKLGNADLNFVLIGICGDWEHDDPGVALAGRILSLYERSDDFGSSCKPLAEKSPGVVAFEEIEFNTGKRHGAFYSADPIWLDPIIAWIGELDP